MDQNRWFIVVFLDSSRCDEIRRVVLVIQMYELRKNRAGPLKIE
jgi:hypothetical protein